MAAPPANARASHLRLGSPRGFRSPHGSLLGRVGGNVRPVLASKAEGAAVAGQHRHRASKLSTAKKDEKDLKEQKELYKQTASKLGIPEVPEEVEDPDDLLSVPHALPEGALSRRNQLFLNPEQAEQAAICIQQAFRRRRSSTRADSTAKLEPRKSRYENREEVDVAASRIQRAFRQKRQKRRKTQKGTSAFVKSSAKPRLVLHKTSIAEEENAARKIQQYFREKLGLKGNGVEQPSVDRRSVSREAQRMQTQSREQRQKYANAMGMGPGRRSTSMKEFEEAALRIQKTFRGHHSRRGLNQRASRHPLSVGSERKPSKARSLAFAAIKTPLLTAGITGDDPVQWTMPSPKHVEATRVIQRSYRIYRRALKEKQDRMAAAQRIQRSNSAGSQDSLDAVHREFSNPTALQPKHERLHADSICIGISGPQLRLEMPRGAMSVVQDIEGIGVALQAMNNVSGTARSRPSRQNSSPRSTSVRSNHRRGGLFENAEDEGIDDVIFEDGSRSPKSPRTAIHIISPSAEKQAIPAGLPQSMPRSSHSVHAALKTARQSTRSLKRAERARERAAERAERESRKSSPIPKQNVVPRNQAYSADIVRRQRADEDPPGLLEVSSLQPCLRKALRKRIEPPAKAPGKQRPPPSGLGYLTARSAPGPAAGVLQRLAERYVELKSEPVDPLTPRSPLQKPWESRLSPRNKSMGARALLSPTTASIACLAERLLAGGGGGSCGGNALVHAGRGISSFRSCWMTQQHRY